MELTKLTLPPLFDDKTDEEVKEEGMEQAELVMQINELRSAQLNRTGGGFEGQLSDDQVRKGVRLTIELRKIRAGGKKAESEVPQILEEKLEDLF